jgi:hypothetical protein
MSLGVKFFVWRLRDFHFHFKVTLVDGHRMHTGRTQDVGHTMGLRAVDMLPNALKPEKYGKQTVAEGQK